MGVNLTLTITKPTCYLTVEQWGDRKPLARPGQAIKPGTLVEYMAHMAGGMVKVRHNDMVVIIHPGCTAELS